MRSDLHELSATGLSTAYERGEVTPVEVLEALRERIARLNPALNAFLQVDSGGDDLGALRGPLAGIPIAIKDNIVTRKAPTTCASRILEGFRSPFDATAVTRLMDAGSCVVGKTNLDEFAMGSSTEHSAFGVTRNPWDTDRVAGGSSGGSAAAVASRMVPVALGSDTGGSVRQPAAFCGVLGLKPTYGRVSRYGLVAFASSLDQIGIMSRTARDCARVLSVIAGYDPLDATSLRAEVPDYERDLDAGIEGVRIGVVAEAIESLTGESREHFDATVRLLESGGAEVSSVSLSTISLAVAVYYVVANAEASANLARFDGIRYGLRRGDDGDLRDTYSTSRAVGFGAEVKRRILLGTFALSAGYYDAYYGRAQAVRAKMRRDFANAFAQVDLLVTPTTPSPAFRVGEKTDDPLSMYLSDIYTAPANLVGIPAIAVPTGHSKSGLPMSTQLLGPDLSEELLLRVASWLEQETGAAAKMPGA